MARPKPDLPPPAQIAALIDAFGRLSIKATPGARAEGLSVSEAVLHAKLRAKPQDGAANTAIAELIARGLGIAPSRVRLARGATSRNKVFVIDRR